MVDLIGAELARASDVGRLDARFLPYHYDLREYVRLVSVMLVCRGRLGNVDALTYVSRLMERAAPSVCAKRGFRNLDKMGLCPICQDGFKSGSMVFLCAVILCI